ncbi:MAG TPA: hypothetical protein VHX15_01525 [Frankiaceae bacterium]|jgi:hypothetical protein|nr:hypothetical protein [Frankiaceae bacterium]
MTSQLDAWANPWVTGMPAELAAVVIRYDKATRRTIIENWRAIGARGQQRYRRYVERAHLHSVRHRRSRRLVVRLITGTA